MKLISWALVLLVVAILLGILGFVVQVGFAITKALCFVALAAAAVLWLSHLGKRRRRVD